MKCYNCSQNGVYRDRFYKSKVYRDEVHGIYSVKDLAMKVCDKCGDTLVDPENAVKMEQAREADYQKTMRKVPEKYFIGLTETAEMLGMSPNQIFRVPRIKRGFILWIKVKGEYRFLKASVEAYKKTGDGRISLIPFWEK